MPDQTPDRPSSAARRKASKALAGRCTARFSAPLSEKTPAWLGGTYVHSDRPMREKLPTTCRPSSSQPVTLHSASAEHTAWSALPCRQYVDQDDYYKLQQH